MFSSDSILSIDELISDCPDGICHLRYPRRWLVVKDLRVRRHKRQNYLHPHNISFQKAPVKESAGNVLIKIWFFVLFFIRVWQRMSCLCACWTY